jgi:ribosome-binding protein aMBF1 (putative translation factor)
LHLRAASADFANTTGYYKERQMRKSKRARLQAAGWTVGTVKEFLGLSEAEASLIEMKLALSRSVRARRKQYGLSQVEFARRLQSSQSRVAKIEAGDPSVSMDLLISSLLLLGATSADLAKAIRGEGRRKNGRAA